MQEERNDVEWFAKTINSLSQEEKEQLLIFMKIMQEKRGIDK